MPNPLRKPQPRTAAPVVTLDDESAAASPRTAAVNSYRQGRTPANWSGAGRSFLSPDSEWQIQVRHYDDQGPIVPQYLSIVAYLSMMSTIRAEYRSPRGWRPIDHTGRESKDERLLALIVDQLFADFYNDDQDPEDMVFDHARALAGVGECALGFVPDYGWVCAQTPEIRPANAVGGEGRGQRALDPMVQLWEWRDPFDVWQPFQNPQRSHFYNHATARRRDATSPLKAGLKHIERYVVSIDRGQMRPVASRMVANGIVRVPHSRNPEANDDLLLDLLEAADNDTADLRYMNSIRDGKRLVPFMVEGDEAVEWIDLGRNMDPMIMEMEMRALRAFARDVGIPIKLLEEGPGNAKYDNEDAVMTAYLREGIQPVLRMVYGAITKFYLRPRLVWLCRQAHTTFANDPSATWRLLRSVDPRKVRLAADAMSLLVQSNKITDLLEARKLGIIERRPIADALGVPLAELPEGVTDHDNFLQINGNGIADGNAGGQIHTNRVAPTLQQIQNASVEIEPAPVIALPAPAPRFAAGRPPEVLSMERILRDIDRDAHEAIGDWMTGVAERAPERLAAAVMRSLPKDSVLRVELRGSAPEAIFAAVGDTFDWARLANEVMAEIDLSEVSRAVQRAHRRVGALDLNVAEPDLISSMRVAANSMTSWLERFPTRPTSMVPTTTVSDVLMAAAGAAVDDRTGLLYRTPEGAPVVDGRHWNGGTGYAMSAPVADTLRAAGIEIEFEWQHGFYQTPRDPFIPHVEMHGERRASAEPADWQYRTPRDHGPFCYCALVPVLKRREAA